MKTILIVDDRPTNREFLSTLLGYGGHRLLEAGDGAEALRLVRVEHPDLVISDILMPTMDGFDFAKSVRAEPAIAATNIIFYTATYRVAEASLLGKACGVSTVIAKPADPEVVLRIVNEQLGIASPPAASGPKAVDASPEIGELAQFGVQLTDYVNDLRSVKNQFDGLVERGLALEQERERLREVSSRFAENLTKLKTASARLYGLIELGMNLAAVDDPQELLNMFTAAACRTLGTATAVGVLLRPTEDLVQNFSTEGLELLAARAMGAMDVNSGLAGESLAARRVMRWVAPAGEPALAGLPAGHPAARCALAIPIASQNGRFGIALLTGKLGQAEFNEQDERMGQALAAILVVIYEKLQLHDILQRHATQLQIVVTERNRSQEALAESEQRFRQLAENMHEVFYLASADSTEFLYVSPAYERVWGRKREQLHAKPDDWIDAIHADDRPRVLEEFTKGLTVGQFDMEYRIVLPDGSIKWIHDRASPVRDERGAVFRIAGIAEDITGRKLGEGQIKLTSAALNAAANAIVITDRNGTIRWVNPAFSALTGYSAEEAIGQNPRILKSGRQGPEFYRRMFDTLLGGSTWQGEIVNRYKDGRLATEEMAITPVRSANGEIEHFIAIKHDVTARKEAEKHRVRLSAILEASPDFVGTSDANLKALYINGAGRQMVGLPENIDLSQAHIRDIHPGWAAELILNTGIPAATRDGVWTGETALLASSGREIPVDQTILSHKGPDGNVEFFSTIARDITESKRANEKIRRLNRVYAVLSGINSTIVRVKDRQELFNEACRIATEHGHFAMAWIGALDPATQDVTPVAWAGESAEALTRAKSSARDDTPLGKGAVGQAIRGRRPVFNNDIANHGFGGPRLEETRKLGFRSQITLPLFDDQVIVGTLTMYASEPNFFDDEELRLLTELAGDISFALENISRQQQLEKLARIRAVSSKINAAIVRIRDRDALLRETCRIASEHGKFGLVWVASLDSEIQEVRPVAWTGFSKAAAHSVTWASIGASRGTLGEAIQTREAAIRNNIETEMPAGELRHEAMKTDCRSTACLPLVVDGQVVALITIFAPGLGFFDKEELVLLDELAADVSFALQSIARQEKVDFLSSYDPLTGLPNRARYVERLGQHLKFAGSGKQVVVMLRDVQRLRLINDTHGRQAGDEILKQVASRLKACVRRPESLARVSADCFATFLPEVTDLREVAHHIEHLRAESVRSPYRVAGQELSLAYTIGAAVYPNDGKDAESLLASAESALRKAKSTGESLQFYEPSINARVAESLHLESKLRRALEKEQFVLHYQPKVELASGRICGLEALIRWNDPETGLVPPGKFIPLLEETGMILDVGRWAMQQALRDCRAWTSQGLAVPRIAVNVSPIQLRQKDFVDIVRNTISASGVECHCLELEITESLLMEDIEGNIKKLHAIRNLGVKVAIDDFGTGYSSLGYLAKLPVDALKIDRSFIIKMTGDSDSMTIVSTMISLAHGLNLKVIAEGVDAEDQRKFLSLLKCDEMQGYLFSKPVDFKAVTALLGTREAVNA